MKKGILVLAALTAALAAPIAASGGASDTATRAQGGDDFHISFTLKTRDGEPTSIKRFRFSRLDAVCLGDTVIEARGRIAYMRINNDNEFKKTLRRPGRSVKVKGRVSGNLQRVVGTIRARGDFGAAQNCDSGRQRWVAD